MDEIGRVWNLLRSHMVIPSFLFISKNDWTLFNHFCVLKMQKIGIIKSTSAYIDWMIDIYIMFFVCQRFVERKQFVVRGMAAHRVLACLPPCRIYISILPNFICLHIKSEFKLGWQCEFVR